MPSPDLQTWLDQVKRELENAVLSPPEWAVDRMTHRLAEAIAKAIPKCFAASIHEVIEKSVEKALSDVVSRGVADGVAKAIRSLVVELGLLRAAMEKNLDDDWWKGDEDQENKPNDEPEDDIAF